MRGGFLKVQTHTNKSLKIIVEILTNMQCRRKIKNLGEGEGGCLVTNKKPLSVVRFFKSRCIIAIYIFSVISEIQNSTPALIKFYKVKHFVPTESWADSDLFQVIKNLKKKRAKKCLTCGQ